ncbi:unnamed protein product [Vitrella brassicaformis CCMP3155]|uniref:Cyclin-dependent kinase 2 homolog n=1 Tax=Vitrella brassicaformis (strain CCMP3155) TaxID=1169540 RepID=A0A0G4GV37_VITBC|nr:unnamed protein product [Vitrella brassicaformis CCMP3155]|eukprot:CEM34706.1 unnamed protein product [Vitrella brassicaformis CCMP3155]
MADANYAGPSLEEVCDVWFQILSGLHQLHRKQLIHLDMKDDNCMVGQDGKTVKVGDLGATRVHNPDSRRHMDTNVVALGMRAPELLMGTKRYGPEVDVWAAGVTIAQFASGRMPFIPTRLTDDREEDLLGCIAASRATPPSLHWLHIDRPFTQRLRHRRLAVREDLDGSVSRAATHGLLSRSKEQGCYGRFDIGQDHPLVDLLDSMLCLEPTFRLTAEQALNHPALAAARAQHECSSAAVQAAAAHTGLNHSVAPEAPLPREVQDVEMKENDPEQPKDPAASTHGLGGSVRGWKRAREDGHQHDDAGGEPAGDVNKGFGRQESQGAPFHAPPNGSASAAAAVVQPLDQPMHDPHNNGGEPARGGELQQPDVNMADPPPHPDDEGHSGRHAANNQPPAIHGQPPPPTGNAADADRRADNGHRSPASAAGQPQAGEAPDQAVHQDDGGDQQRLDPAGIESSRRGAKRGRDDDRDEGGDEMGDQPQGELPDQDMPPVGHPGGDEQAENAADEGRGGAVLLPEQAEPAAKRRRRIPPDEQPLKRLRRSPRLRKRRRREEGHE